MLLSPTPTPSSCSSPDDQSDSDDLFEPNEQDRATECQSLVRHVVQNALKNVIGRFDPAPSPAVTSNIVNGASAKLDALFWPVAAASSVANASWSNLQAVWTGHAQRPCTCTTAVHTVEHI